jgi:HK97 family phage major capsid protein/HK97 family phage prohead protease
MSGTVRLKDAQVEQRAWACLEIKSIDEEKREIEGIATTPTPDRVGDIVEPKGAEFKLPVPFLWQHRSSEPIGHVVSATVGKDGIRVRVKLAKTDVPGKLKDRLDEAWQSIKLGLVRGLSIGFKGVETSFIEESRGIRFLKWVWLELSAVTIPANEEASITAIKSAGATQQRPTLGASQGTVRLALPGASGNNVANQLPLTGKGNETMKTTREQITAFEAKRAATVARMDEVMSKAAEEGRTLDDTEQQSYDNDAREIETIDAHLKRLISHEKTMLQTATPATSHQSTSGGESAPGIRAGEGVLRANSNTPKGTAFTRYALALLHSKGDLGAAAATAKRLWDTSTPEVSSVLKAAQDAGTTTDATWAGNLVQYQNMQSEFIELLRPETIIGRIPGFRRVPFNIRIPRQTAGVSGAFVGEGAPKPVNEMGFDTITMQWYKAAVIVVLTEELVRFSNPNAENLARQDMVRGIAEYLDKRFIDPVYPGVSGVSPASITNSVTQVNSTGVTLAAITNDVETLMRAFITANMTLTNGVWIMTPGTALALSLLRTSQDVFAFPNITMNGGTWFGLPVITSGNLSLSGSPTETFIVLMDASEILLADDGQVVISVSREASLQMNDAPSAGAQSLVSLWQNNLVGLRAERFINWQKRRAEAVQVLHLNAGY